ncbi:hypothetical protein [Streptomyces sp. NPDC058701]
MQQSQAALAHSGLTPLPSLPAELGAVRCELEHQVVVFVRDVPLEQM